MEVIDYRKLILLFLLTTLSACATNEPIVVSTPDHNKHISGSISENKYYAMDNSFSIALPYKKGSIEYALMDIDEFYYENGSNVVFIGKDKSTYSLELYRVKEQKNTIDTFEETSLKLLYKYHKSFYKTITNLKVLNKKHIKIAGNRTIHWNLLQNPKKYDSSYSPIRHHIFAIKVKHYIVIIMVEKPANDPDGESFLTAYNFAYSLSLLD
ncbi:MAG: hypothetical protein ACC657_16480 [Thiohalomonadales bacterium]